MANTIQSNPALFFQQLTKKLDPQYTHLACALKENRDCGPGTRLIQRMTFPANDTNQT